MSAPRTVAEVKADYRVAKVWRENDGAFSSALSYWAELAPGFNWEGCGCLHEATIRDLCAALSEVVEGPRY